MILKDITQALQSNLNENVLNKIPQDIEDGKPLPEKEEDWLRHVTKTGLEVKIVGLDKPGKVIQGAKDPINGKGMDRRAYVAYEHNGTKYRKWYDAKELEPLKG